MRRYDLTDNQWQSIEHLFPTNEGSRGRPPRSHRVMLNGILWVLFSGASWRDVPELFGPWKTVYDRFRRWSNDEAFNKVLDHLQWKTDEQGLLDWTLFSVASTSVKASKAAAGAKKNYLEDYPDQALGRSKGGLGTKVHAVCDGKGLPLSFVLTANQRHDSVVFTEVISKVWVRQNRGRPKNRPIAVAADKAYDSKANRRYISRRKIESVIPEKKLRPNTKRRQMGPRPKLDIQKYKGRNTIERMFGWLKCRRIRTRYKKKATHFLAMVKLGAIRLYLRRYFSDTA